MKYSIEGAPLPVVICNLDEGESVICQSGAMSWMSPNMKMETDSGGIKSMLGHLITSEKVFMNHYTAQGDSGMIAFSASLPGEIRALDITPNNDMVVQKSAFLASTPGVELSVFFQKKIETSIFGGEGFVMQKLSGQGTAFVALNGYIKEYTLADGESMIVNTGYVAAMSSTCKMDVQEVPGLKNMLFGGEGIFNTVVTGPGDVWLQSLPISQIVKTLSPFLPKQNSN